MDPEHIYNGYFTPRRNIEYSLTTWPHVVEQPLHSEQKSLAHDQPGYNTNSSHITAYCPVHQEFEVLACETIAREARARLTYFRSLGLFK